MALRFQQESSAFCISRVRENSDRALFRRCFPLFLRQVAR